MKFQLFLLITSLIVASQQEQQDNKWQPESDNYWGPEPVPKPRSPCNCLAKASDVEFTPIVDVDITYDTTLTCATNSKFNQVTFQTTLPARISCNGAAVDTNDYTYVGVISGGYGHKSTVKLNLTNYTANYVFINGNTEFQDCGTISGGKCSGDTFIGVGIYKANDQKGCCKGGITGMSSSERTIEIIGNCASKCSLTSSAWALAEPVSNKGLVDRSIVVESYE